MQSLNPCCNGNLSKDLWCQGEIDNYWSLNPCCNGRYSMSERKGLRKAVQREGLNPCCNGRYSMSHLPCKC